MNNRQVEYPEPLTDLEVCCADTGQSLGRIVDVTSSGMRLITAGELVLEAEYRLVIPTPGGPGAHEELRIDARCMWIGHDLDPELYLAGFEFRRLRPQQQQLLARLVETDRVAPQYS